MQLGALFTGGKDSVFSIFKAINTGHELKCLITIISKNPESYMYHVPNIELTSLQAKAMEFVLEVVGANPDGIDKNKLAPAAFEKFPKDDPDRGGIIALIFKDEYLSNGPWKYEGGRLFPA